MRWSQGHRAFPSLWEAICLLDWTPSLAVGVQRNDEADGDAPGDTRADLWSASGMMSRLLTRFITDWMTALTMLRKTLHRHMCRSIAGTICSSKDCAAHAAEMLPPE
jgi:hypothetical protein